MQRSLFAALVLLLGLTLAVGLWVQATERAEPTATVVAGAADGVVRIGTYDNRAIAIAFTGSRFDTEVSERKAEQAEARAAGDTARVAELEAWGRTHQQKRHFQGFGRYPVDDLLAPIADELASLCTEREIDALVWMVDYHGPDVEVVDLTMEIVALYEPREQAEEWVRQMFEHEPVPFETLIGLDPAE